MALMTLTLERLREVLNYDRETGVFTWKIAKASHVQAGARAGTVTKYGYRAISVDGHRALAHRLAWFYMHGVWPVEYIDHKNGNRDDNTERNLREATNSQNVANQDGHKDSSTGLRGIYKNGNRWAATVMKNRTKYWVGNFETPEEAHAAYLVAAKSLFGEFARAA